MLLTTCAVPQQQKVAAKADAAAIARAKAIVEETARQKKKDLANRAKGITGSAYHGAWEDADYDEGEVSGRRDKGSLSPP